MNCGGAPLGKILLIPEPTMSNGLFANKLRNDRPLLTLRRLLKNVRVTFGR